MCLLLPPCVFFVVVIVADAAAAVSTAAVADEDDAADRGNQFSNTECAMWPVATVLIRNSEGRIIVPVLMISYRYCE